MELLKSYRALPKPTSKTKRTFGEYRCDCGNTFTCLVDNVNRGMTKGCGCTVGKANITHGLSGHPLYSVWVGMMSRTSNPKNSSYKNYGGRGITVCARWLTVENFIEDMFPTYKSDLTLDRRENDGNYEPRNCRWVTKEIQSRNSRIIYAHNTSGYRGVYWSTRRNHWIAQIRIKDKNTYIGSAATAIDAANLYDAYVIEKKLEHTRNFK